MINMIMDAVDPKFNRDVENDPQTGSGDSTIC